MTFHERQFTRIGLASLMAVVGLSAIAIVANAATYAVGNSLALGWLGAVWFAFNALLVVPLLGSTIKQFLRETPGNEKAQYVLSSLR